MENFKEKVCLCALNRIFGFEPKTGLALIAHLGSARRIFELSSEELEMMTGPYFKFKDMICSQALDKAAEELESMAGMGVAFCGITEQEYPPLLKECADAPIGIYIRSQTPVSELWSSRSVAVVGTRDISPYGKEWCGRIVRGLSMTGNRVPVISGLAIGVDIEAHKTAIECGLPTLAVMATGPDSIYPYRHRSFAEQMACTPGCALVTDYPPGTPPLAVHFLRRNRIIAGLAASTILVESKIRGGGLMTSNLAFSYSRDVYALPGRADDLRSAGCNELIRRKVAEPVTSIDGLIESLGLEIKDNRRNPGHDERLRDVYGGSLLESEIHLMEKTLSLLRQHPGLTAEELARNAEIPYSKANETVHMLEIDGFIYIDLFQRCFINSKFM